MTSATVLPTVIPLRAFATVVSMTRSYQKLILTTLASPALFLSALHVLRLPKMYVTRVVGLSACCPTAAALTMVSSMMAVLTAKLA